MRDMVKVGMCEGMRTGIYRGVVAGGFNVDIIKGDVGCPDEEICPAR